MADDNKYADLPGIDYNSATCFETKDCPEPTFTRGGTDSNIVEEIKVDLAAAQEKFGKDILKTAHADFSDSIAKERHGGYELGQREYELLSCTTNETPLQRFQRLKVELNEFGTELENMKEEDVKETDHIALAEQVRKLSKNLSEMKVEQMIGKLKMKEPGHGALTKQLTNQISSFKDKSAKEGGSAGVVTYEVHYRGDHAKFAEAAKLAALDKRIGELEKGLGKDTKVLASITSDMAPSEKNVMGAINNLQVKLSLIDPNDYTHLDTRLQAVLHKMEQLKARSKEIPEPNNKVGEVFDMLRKVEPVVSTLPDIVERLTALKSLHEQATTLAGNLTQLESTQSNITKSISQQESLLKKVEENISGNMMTIVNNCTNLNTRIDKLVTKVAPLTKKKEGTPTKK